MSLPLVFSGSGLFRCLWTSRPHRRTSFVLRGDGSRRCPGRPVLTRRPVCPGREWVPFDLRRGETRPSRPEQNHSWTRSPIVGLPHGSLPTSFGVRCYRASSRPKSSFRAFGLDTYLCILGNYRKNPPRPHERTPRTPRRRSSIRFSSKRCRTRRYYDSSLSPSQGAHPCLPTTSK